MVFAIRQTFINTINDIIKKIKNMIKTFEQFISESCSSPNCMLKWTDADKVDYKKLNTYVLKKKNANRKGGYSFIAVTIPFGGLDMPISKRNDTPISEYIKTCEEYI